VKIESSSKSHQIQERHSVEMEGEAVAQQNFEEAREDASKRLADLMQEYLSISAKVKNR
jgi:hypothetical protein